MEAKGVPENANELNQAVLPEDQAASFASKGKIFQTGQIWSFCSGLDNLPLYYGRIQKITFTHEVEQEAVYKLHMSRLKATDFPSYVIQWEDKKMPVGCGTFCATKAQEIINGQEETPEDRPPGVKAAKAAAKRKKTRKEDAMTQLQSMLELKEKISKQKLLDRLFAKTEPLSELEVSLKMKLIADML